MINQQALLMVRIIISAWNMQNRIMKELIDNLSDEQLQRETAPGRNTGVYLLGHITAVSDDVVRVLGIGERLYPEYDDLFISSPDKSGKAFPTIAELKAAYHTVSERLDSHFADYSLEDWLSKHTVVSEEDFHKEPMRNKLNVVINRTNHLCYHIGQLVYLST